MARRSGVQEFLNNFNAAFNATRQVGQAFETANVMREKPLQSEVFTPEQGEEISAAAESGQNHIGYDDASKAYVVTPKLADGEMGPAMPKSIAQQGVTDFMGKRTAGAMSEEQANSARFKAMAGVMSKYDPVAGMRMQREVKQGERDDQRFEWDKSRNERDIRVAGEQDADKAYGKQLDTKVGEWFKGRLKNPDGTDRAATVDDHLAASQFRAAQLTEAGKLEQAGQVLKDYSAQSFTKIQLEGAARDQALSKTSAALAAGDLSALKDFYNHFIPDGARVTDVKRGANGQVVIQRETLDGRSMPETVMKDMGQLAAGLAAFKDPMAVYQWSQNEFKNTLSLRAEARADQSLALQGAGIAESRANREFTRAQEAKKAAAAVAVYKEDNPNASPARLEAVYRGAIPLEAKRNQYKTEAGDITTLLGKPAVDSNGKPAVDPITQKQYVNRDPEKEAAFFEFMQQNKITDTNEGLQRFIASGAGAGGAGAGGARAAPPKSEADAHAQALDALRRGTTTIERANARLKEIGFSPLSQGGATPAPAAAPQQRMAPPPAQPAAPRASNPVLDAPQAQAADAARAEVTAARMALQGIGLKQRKNNPEAYAAAMERALRAKQAAKAAEMDWLQFVSQQGVIGPVFARPGM